jgi:hypothetical protein
MKSPSKLLGPVLAVLLCGCSSLRNPPPHAAASQLPPYEVACRLKGEINLGRVNELWTEEGLPPVTRAEDAFRVVIDLGDKPLVVDTHLFGPLRVIPYADGDDTTDSQGLPVGRGDAVLSTYFPPGEIGVSVEHHRPRNRYLSFGQETGSDAIKEHFKLQDSHAGLLVGVQRDGSPGVVSLNNPQSFEDGGLGGESEPRIYLRPVYPWYLGRERQAEFRDNIRTMAMGFNAVSDFPEDYNGGDPLAARTPDEVREHVRRMVLAIAGDSESREWFLHPDHRLYCSEFAHLSFSAGLIVPLNEKTISGLAGPRWWKKFSREVEAHNAGEPSAFTELNQNPNARLIRLALAPASLKPAAEYAVLADRERSLLAFRPMTMADIIDHFMSLHFPRATMGEGLASTQTAVFQQLRPGLLEMMAMADLPDSDPQRRAVDELFDRLTAVVSQEHSGYAAFRAALQPLLDEARTMSGPRDGSGTGLFVPPHLLHLVAQGRHPGGLLGLEYVGHGLHWSVLDRVEPTPF